MSCLVHCLRTVVGIKCSASNSSEIKFVSCFAIFGLANVHSLHSSSSVHFTVPASPPSPRSGSHIIHVPWSAPPISHGPTRTNFYCSIQWTGSRSWTSTTSAASTTSTKIEKIEKIPKNRKKSGKIPKNFQKFQKLKFKFQKLKNLKFSQNAFLLIRNAQECSGAAS